MSIADDLAAGLVGVLAALAAGKASSGVVCSRCGGLRSRARGFCDVCQALRSVAERDYLIGEVEFLAGTDSPHSIARRLGYSQTQYLARVLVRYGRPDLAASFYAKEVAA